MQQINWGQRSQDEPITFDGDAQAVCEGCIVDLEHEGTRVTVRVQGQQDEAWTGEITGFPGQAEAVEVGQLKVGSTIQFQDDNVLRCAA
jgi:hypothetical protein